MTSVVISGSISFINTPTAPASEPHEEYYTNDGGFRKLVAPDSPDGEAIREKIKSNYGNILDEYPAYYFGYYEKENIATLFTPSFDNNITILELKFYFNDKSLSRKEVNISDNSTNYNLPEGCVVLGEGFYKPVEGFNFPERLYSVVDIYFKGGHEEICQHFNYEFPKGDFRTYYGASVNKETGVIGKIKSYVYNEASPQAVWEEAYAAKIAKLNRIKNADTTTN